LVPNLAATLLCSISNHVPASRHLTASSTLLPVIAAAAAIILSPPPNRHEPHPIDSAHHTAALLLCCLPTCPPHPSLISFPSSLISLLLYELSRMKFEETMPVVEVSWWRCPNCSRCPLTQVSGPPQFACVWSTTAWRHCVCSC
jgi:hypothetical protein